MPASPQRVWEALRSAEPGGSAAEPRTPCGQDRTYADISLLVAAAPGMSHHVTGERGGWFPSAAGVADRPGWIWRAVAAPSRATRRVPPAVPRHPAPPLRYLHALPARTRGHRSEPGCKSPATCPPSPEPTTGSAAGSPPSPATRPGPPAPPRPQAPPWPSPPKTWPPGRRDDTAQHGPRRRRHRQRHRPDRHLPPTRPKPSCSAPSSAWTPRRRQVLGKRAGAIRTAAHRGLHTLHKKLERARSCP